MAQMNGMEKRNFTNSTQNGGKKGEMRNNSAKSGMVGMPGNEFKTFALTMLDACLMTLAGVLGTETWCIGGQ